MDEFSYLSVLLSIILGLAVTQILQGFRERMLSHARITDYWPSRMWAASTLLVCAQTWWAMFGLRDRHDWEFNQFLVLLGQTIVLYLVAGLVFPNFPPAETVDMREHYFAQRSRFFSLLLALAVLSLLRDVILDHALPEKRNLLFHFGFVSIALLGLIFRYELLHKALALITAFTFVEYISTLFTRLTH